MNHTKDQELDDMAILAEIASMYYEYDIPQYEIARRLFYSKAKVSRLLKRARESGIVEINIKYPIQRAGTLEHELIQTLGLKDAIVIRNYPEHNNPEIRLKRLGRIAAEYLDQMVSDGDTVGVGWGRTLYQMAEAMNPERSRQIRFVQLMGAASDEYHTNLDSPALIRSMAEKYKGSYTPLYAPLYVGNALVKHSLIKEPLIAKALWEGSHVKYIVTGVADFTGDKTISWAGYMNQKMREAYEKRGAVGFICGHFIDKNGRNVLPEVENNLIGITLADIKKNEHVIAVAGGVDKALATYGAIRGGYIKTLVTDKYIAEKLLTLGKSVCG